MATVYYAWICRLLLLPLPCAICQTKTPKWILDFITALSFNNRRTNSMEIQFQTTRHFSWQEVVPMHFKWFFKIIFHQQIFCLEKICRNQMLLLFAKVATKNAGDYVTCTISLCKCYIFGANLYAQFQTYRANLCVHIARVRVLGHIFQQSAGENLWSRTEFALIVFTSHVNFVHICEKILTHFTAFHFSWF